MVLDPDRPSPATPAPETSSAAAARPGWAAEALQAARRLAPDRLDVFSVARLIWLPACAVVAGAALDLSLAYRTHAQMQDVARDAARMVAGGEASLAQAEVYALSRLPGPAAYSIMVTERPAPEGRPDVLVAISTSSRSVGLFGALQLFDVDRLTARHATRKEALDQAHCAQGCPAAPAPSGG